MPDHRLRQAAPLTYGVFGLLFDFGGMESFSEQHKQLLLFWEKGGGPH